MTDLFDPTKLKILGNFRIMKKMFFLHRFWTKDIFYAYEFPKELIERWEENGFWKSQPILKFLETKYIGLNNFKLILFVESAADDFYEIKNGEVTDIFLNYPKLVAYCKCIDKFLNKLKIVKFNFELHSLFNEKIAESFFNKVPADILKEQINVTNFKIIESILTEFDSLPDDEKSKLLEKIEHSSPGTKIIEKYRELKPEAPEVQLKLFMKVIDKLGSEGFAELARSILSGDRLIKLVKEVGNLSISDQTLLIKNVPSAARLLNLNETLKSSVQQFENMIKKRAKSESKKEADIHSFLSSNYWLLGIEYFDRVLKTSINEFGKKINETAFYNFTAVPDFTIEMINGNIDECVVIELEEANDMIFKNDGNLSKQVFDGINQAMIYVVLKKVEGKDARGIAVIGSTGKLNQDQIEQIRILKNSYPMVKIMTYEDMISNANTIIKFLEKYKNKIS